MRIHFPKNLPCHPERWVIILIIGVFLALNMVSLTRLPSPMMDEAIDTDVAAHLYRGKGYISHADPISKSGQFLIAHPAYHLMLAGWFECFGFGVSQSRAFDVALLGLTALAFWLGAWFRLGPSAWVPRVCILAMVLFADDFVRSYRGHRYDPPSLLWMALLYLSATHSRPGWRYLFCFLAAALVPLSSMNGIILLGITLAWLFLVHRQKYFFICLASGLGLLSGIAVYLGLLASNGVLDGWLDQIMGFASGSKTGAWHIIAWRGIRWGHSCMLLGIMACILLVLEKGSTTRRTLLVHSLLAILIIPITLSLAGNYTYYYVWTTTTAVILLIAHACALQPQLKRSSTLLLVSTTILVCLMGLPQRVIKIIPEWNERNLEHLSGYVRSQLTTNDVVFLDAPGAYYATAEIAEEWYFATYRAGMSEQDKKRLSVIILAPGENDRPKPGWKEKVFTDLGGNWHKVGNFNIPRSELRMRLPNKPRTPYVHELEIYRRAPTLSSEPTPKS